MLAESCFHTHCILRPLALGVPLCLDASNTRIIHILNISHYISIYISIILYILHRTCMFNPFPHIGSLFSSAVHFLPGMFTSKYLKCLMMYSGLLAINYPILSTQNRDFHIHPHIPCFFYLFMVMTGGWFIIVLTTLIWVNYNDLTATSLELWLVIGIIPEKPYFRLVNYCNLPRYYEYSIL